MAAAPINSEQVHLPEQDLYKIETANIFIWIREGLIAEAMRSLWFWGKETFCDVPGKFTNF